MLYSLNGAYPTKLPDKIYLSNGTTRTDKTSFTDDELADAGYVKAPDVFPKRLHNQKYDWDGNNWVVVNMSDEEFNKIKKQKQTDINNFIYNEIYRIEQMLYYSFNEVTGEKYFRPSLDEESKEKMLVYIEQWKQHLNKENPFEYMDEPMLELSNA